MGITETWLTSDYWDNEILPQGYTIYRRDSNSRGGGVLLAVKNDISSKIIDTLSDIEGVTVEINHMNPVISVIYATPQSSMKYFNTCSKYLSNLSDTCLPLLLWVISISLTLTRRHCQGVPLFPTNFVSKSLT